MLAGAWSGWRSRKHLPQAHPLAASRPPSVTFENEPPPNPPSLFTWRLRVDGVHSAQRRFSVVLPRDAAQALTPDWPRGRYRLTAQWELADWFGFTRLVVPPRHSTILTVEPVPREFRPTAAPEHRRGSSRPRRSGRRVGEPFDVRHYVPGDDLRRLHWPLYAHSDSLFVRTAEVVPPPAGHEFIVLDLAASSEEDLDYRLELLRGWLAELDARGGGWTVAVPAAQLTIGPGTLEALAGLSPSSSSVAVDSSWPETVSLMGSETAIAPLVRELTHSRRRVRPVVVEPQPMPSAKLPWWRRS